jgi:hypothetical protein
MTSDSTEKAPETLSYGLNERMVLVQVRLQSRLGAMQTEPYGLDERMTVAYLRHEMAEAVERVRVCREIDELLRRTRPNMQRHDPRSLLWLLRERS